MCRLSDIVWGSEGRCLDGSVVAHPLIYRVDTDPPCCRLASESWLLFDFSIVFLLDGGIVGHECYLPLERRKWDSLWGDGGYFGELCYLLG